MKKKRFRILVVNGPNLNMLGTREPEIYGKISYRELEKDIRIWAKSMEMDVKVFQSNCEGKLIDKIQKALGKFDGIVINPGGYTHTSVALADALKAVALPAVEVHISDINGREAFRKISYIKPVCFASITGKGESGYKEALEKLKEKLDR